MAAKFSPGDTVFVPAAYTQNPDTAPYALLERKVLEVNDRSILFDDNSSPRKVASRHVHPGTLGFLLLRIGDLRTERTLLDPLAKSILQFLRLLLPDNDIHSLNVRTLAELIAWWKINASTISHVVLIGHGTPNSIHFVEPEMPVSGADLGRRVAPGDRTPGLPQNGA